MKNNARFAMEGVKNNVQGKAHYQVLIQGIISGGILQELANIAAHFYLHTGAGIFGYSRAQHDESYRILPPSQNPQNPALNPLSTKTLEKMEATRL
jgi:hypothetical protein